MSDFVRRLRNAAKHIDPPKIDVAQVNDTTVIVTWSDGNAATSIRLYDHNADAGEVIDRLYKHWKQTRGLLWTVQ